MQSAVTTADRLSADMAIHDTAFRARGNRIFELFQIQPPHGAAQNGETFSSCCDRPASESSREEFSGDPLA